MLMQKDVDRYVELMKDINQRLSICDNILNGKNPMGNEIYSIEVASLQFRKIFETIAVSSFIAQEPSFEKAKAILLRKSKARVLLRELERMNKDFFPRPAKIFKDDKNNVTITPSKVIHLTANDLVKGLERSSSVLHVRNPNLPRLNGKEIIGRFIQWRTNIISLLKEHTIHLKGDSGFFIVQMMAPDTLKPVMVRAEPSKNQ